MKKKILIEGNNNVVHEGPKADTIPSKVIIKSQHETNIKLINILNKMVGKSQRPRRKA